MQHHTHLRTAVWEYWFHVHHLSEEHLILYAIQKRLKREFVSTEEHYFIKLHIGFPNQV